MKAKLFQPEQAGTSHFICSSASPLHFSPPYKGAGLSHLRMRNLTDSPQLCEQDVHCDHVDHSPFTGYKLTW